MSSVIHAEKERGVRRIMIDINYLERLGSIAVGFFIIICVAVFIFLALVWFVIPILLINESLFEKEPPISAIYFLSVFIGEVILLFLLYDHSIMELINSLGV